MLLRMGNVSKVLEKIKTHILSCIIPPTENRTFYEIMWEDTKRVTFKDKTHCYVSIATVVTRTRHGFYVVRILRILFLC
jgi:hypothetical protein